MKLKKYIALSESGVVFNGSAGDSFSADPVAVKIIEMLQRGCLPQHMATVASTYQKVGVTGCPTTRIIPFLVRP